MIRRSPADQKNPAIGDWSKWGQDKSNLEFFEEALEVMTQKCGLGTSGEMIICLVGSRDIPGIHLRRAQSVLRWDRKPSLWSHALIIDASARGKKKIGNLPIYEIPLFPRNGQFPSPAENGLVKSTLKLYNDAEIDPNVAMLVVGANATDKVGDLDEGCLKKLRERAKNPNFDRLRFDFWDSLCAWNKYIWSEGEDTNPLKAGVPISSAAYIEMIFEAIGLDLVPGASERHSAPEHIWSTALWWLQNCTKKYNHNMAHAISGCFLIRDAGCSSL